MNFEKFKEQAVQFLERLSEDLEKNSIFLDPNWDVDHLCYRVDSLELYEAFKNDFAKFATFLIESEVNGRPIATYKLIQPLQFKDWTIQIVELPAPKKSKPTVTGFEHIEIVCDMGLEQLAERFKHLNLDFAGLHKDINQELEICLGSRNIKFHHMSLESLINLERNQKVDLALKKSEVLRTFKKYAPRVVGTFPLDLHQVESDLDIVMGDADLDELHSNLTLYCGKFADFKIQRSLFKYLDTVIAQFKVDDVGFEIFAQGQKSSAQPAFLHFLVEERLLKIGGEHFKAKVKEMRAQGLKTEPAYAHALKLTGDSYIELLKLQKKSNEELRAQFFANEN